MWRFLKTELVMMHRLLLRGLEEAVSARQRRRGGGRGGESRGVGVLTVGGVILHKVFGLLCCDHIDVTHLHTETHSLTLEHARAGYRCRFSSETHLVSEFDTIELVSGLQQLRPEGGGDELGVARQLHNHVCRNKEPVIV